MSDSGHPLTRRAFLRRSSLGIAGTALAAPPLATTAGAASVAASHDDTRGLTETPRPLADVPAADLPASSTTETFWRAVARLYPVTEERTYLNTGGLGPVAYPVLHSLESTTRDLIRISETGHRLIEEARGPVAAFLGAAPEEICFTRNATEGNSIVASGLALKPGDEVVLDSHAHPGGAIPWLNRQKADGIRVRLFDPDAQDNDAVLERITAQLTPRTRVIQVSHVTAPTGILLPVDRIAELAAERGIWFHIDGAQSAGMLPIDLHAIGCDSWATSGHKWLGAPHGTGVLYIRRDRLDAVTPTEVGAYSDAGYHLPDEFEYIDTARRHESGTRNAALVHATLGATEFMDRIGMDRVRDRGLELTGMLRDRLTPMSGIQILTPTDPSRHGSMLTFTSDRIAFDDMYRHLSREHELRCRIVTERTLNAVRISLHVFNLPADVERVAAGVADALDKLG